MSVDEANTNTALAGALVDELARAGCSQAVVCPGSRSTPVSVALARHPEIEIQVVLDERVAGFLALGVALATGAPAPISVTSGSAAANLHPAVVEADQAGVPMVILSSDRPPELRGIGAGQTIDQIKLYGGAVRWFCEVGTHEASDQGLLHYRAVGARAVAEATRCAGPVHLNLAWREPLGTEPVNGAVTATAALALEGRSDGEAITRLELAREPADQALDQLAARLSACSRPVIVAGRQRRPDLPEAIIGLAKVIGAPVLAEPTSGLRHGVAADAALIGTYELVCRKLPDRLRPDLVLRFGDMPTSKALRATLIDPSIAQIVVTDRGGWNEPSRIAADLIAADAVAVAAGLTARLEREASELSFFEGWITAERASQRAIDSGFGDDFSEPAIHRALYDHLPDGASLLLASSMPIRDAESFSPVTDLRIDVLANRGANGIDGLISTATGIALSSGGPTFAVLGDLASVHDLGGLVNLGDCGADLRLLVINNGGGRIFEFLPQHEQLPDEEFQRLFTTPSKVDLADAAKLAGVDYHRAESISELSALEQAGPSLVEAVVDPSRNVELHRSLASAVAQAIA